jgi:hypothetical protein
MRVTRGRKVSALLGTLLLMVFATSGSFTGPPAVSQLPNPVLVFRGQEHFETDGKQWTRYKYSVYNRDQYPNELFASAPELPPCGRNTQSSRTWVDMFEQNGRRLYGFCALKNRDGLGQLWFALERHVVPPSWIYLEMTDRKTNTSYKSNLAETTE